MVGNVFQEFEESLSVQGPYSAERESLRASQFTCYFPKTGSSIHGVRITLVRPCSSVCIVLLDSYLPVLHNLRQGDLVVLLIEVGWRTSRFG